MRRRNVPPLKAEDFNLLPFCRNSARVPRIERLGIEKLPVAGRDFSPGRLLFSLPTRRVLFAKRNTPPRVLHERYGSGSQCLSFSFYLSFVEGKRDRERDRERKKRRSSRESSIRDRSLEFHVGGCSCVGHDCNVYTWDVFIPGISESDIAKRSWPLPTLGHN